MSTGVQEKGSCLPCCLLPEHAGIDGEEGLSQVLERGGSEVPIFRQHNGVHGLMDVVGFLETIRGENYHNKTQSLQVVNSVPPQN